MRGVGGVVLGDEFSSESQFVVSQAICHKAVVTDVYKAMGKAMK